jgi:hypothetical protein
MRHRPLAYVSGADQLKGQSDVDSRTRKRVVIAGAILVVFLANAIVLLLRARQRPTADFVRRPISQELKAPLNVESSPDVSALEKQFSTVVSFAPLCGTGRVIQKLVYDVSNETLSERRTTGGFDGDVFANIPFRKPDALASDTKIVTFQDASSADRVQYSERLIPKNPKTEFDKLVSAQKGITGELYIDGRRNVTIEDSGYREVDPFFPSYSVKKGDRWLQEMEVDPRVNPERRIHADVAVLSTYVKDSHRIVRVSRSYAFKARIPSPPRLKSASTSKPKDHHDGDSEKIPVLGDVMLMRITEIIDIDVDLGIIVNSVLARQICFDQVKGGNEPDGTGGRIIMTRSNAVLRKIEKTH